VTSSLLPRIVLGLLSFTGLAAEPEETKQEAIVRLTNAFRKEQKVPPLAVSEALAKVAQDHAANMARQDKHGDDNRNGHVLDGKQFQDRIDASPYKYTTAGENTGVIIRGADPVAIMIQGWKQSPSHRKTMLTEAYTEIGVGAAQSKSGRWYFVQVYANPVAPQKK
jgi:uncharacterized protein YkwD